MPDFVEIALEESPLNEQTWDDAVTPSRISTVLLYPPARSARIAPTPQHLSRADEMRGILGEVKRLIETYEPVGIWTERLYPKDATWLLELAGFDGVFTAGDGIITDPDAAVIPAGASRWVFNKRDSIDAQTARIRTNYMSENVLMEGYGFGASSFSLNAEGEASADLVGLFMRRLAASGTVPSVVASAIPPFRRGDLFVTGLTGGGRIGDFTVSVSNPIERIRSLSLNPSSDWPDALEHGDEQVTVTGTIPKRILDADDVDALMAATSFALTARWKMDTVIGGTAYTYSLWLQCPAAQLISGEADELSNRRRHGHSFEWFAAYDEVAGYDARWTLVNDVAAISTPF